MFSLSLEFCFFFSKDLMYHIYIKKMLIVNRRWPTPHMPLIVTLCFARRPQRWAGDWNCGVRGMEGLRDESTHAEVFLALVIRYTSWRRKTPHYLYMRWKVEGLTMQDIKTGCCAWHLVLNWDRLQFVSTFEDPMHQPHFLSHVLLPLTEWETLQDFYVYVCSVHHAVLTKLH